jgi:hypothetical protein
VNRRALIYLRDLGGICGRNVHTEYGHRLCLLRPDHYVPCSAEWPRDITREDRLLRDIAKLKAQRDRRQRHREHLIRLCRELQRQQVRDRSYIGFRIEFRLIGLRNRLRRYWRMSYHRAVLKPLGRWP